MIRLLFYIPFSDMPHVLDRGYSYLVISFMVSLFPRPDFLTVVYLSNAIPLRPALAHTKTFSQIFSKSTHLPPVALSRLATSSPTLGTKVSERLVDQELCSTIRSRQDQFSSNRLVWHLLPSSHLLLQRLMPSTAAAAIRCKLTPLI